MKAVLDYEKARSFRLVTVARGRVRMARHTAEEARRTAKKIQAGLDRASRGGDVKRLVMG